MLDTSFEKKVLLVDDENDFLDLAKIYLKKEIQKLDIDTVNSPTKALKLLKENEYDCIVSDYQMPEMNGLELLEKIKDDLNKDTPFIIFTGKGREEVAMNALNLGADRYLKKGGNPKTQFAVLADAIKQEVEHFRTKRRAKELEYLRSTIRRINQILTESRDIKNAIEKICRALLETKGYLDISIALEEKNKIKAAASCGDHERKKWKICLNKNLESQEAPECIKESIKTKEKVIIENKNESSYCKECNICLYKDNHSSITIPIEINDRLAILNACLKIKRLSEQELRLLDELANDIKKGFKRIEIEKRLETFKKEYKDLINSMNDSVFVNDFDGNLLVVNDEAIKKLGYKKKELLSMNLKEIDASKDSEKLNNRIQKVRGGKKSVFESTLLTKNGEELSVEINSNLVKYHGKPAILSVARDVSERRKLETKKELYSFSLEKATPEVYWVTPGGKFAYVNQAAEEKLGYSKEELKEMHVWGIDPLHGKEIREKIWNKLKEEKSLDFETKHQTKKGETYPVHITNHYIEFKDKEYEFSFARDISEKKKAEEREKFLHSLLRHDVKNKSQVVEGYLELVEEYELPSEVEDYINKAKRATKEGKEVIEKVKALRELEEIDTKKINIKPIIEDVINEREAIAKEKNIEIKCTNCKGTVQGGETLEEVFSNLIENSIKHSNCGTIKISTEIEEENCVITIEDDGKGISEEEKQKIFKKGYKNEKTGGTGLGLYLVKKITNSYGGKVEAKDSKLGGARFDVILPTP